VRLADVQVMVDMAIIVWVVDAIRRPVDSHVLHQERRRLRAKGVVDLPYLHITDHERVFLVRADAVDALAEVETIEAVAVGLVVLEADERQRANVDRLAAAIGLLDGKRQAEPAGARGLEAVAVALVFAGNVA